MLMGMRLLCVYLPAFIGLFLTGHHKKNRKKIKETARVVDEQSSPHLLRRRGIIRVTAFQRQAYKSSGISNCVDV